MAESGEWRDLRASVDAVLIETPTQAKAAELLATEPVVIASRNGEGPTELGLMRDCLAAYSYRAIRDAVAAEIERLTTPTKSGAEAQVDMSSLMRARDVIADEIRGCSFDFEDKQGALERAEGIIVALELMGMAIVKRAAI